MLITISNDGNQNAVFDFNSKADIDSVGVDNSGSDETARDSGIFGKGDGQRADGIQGDAGLRILRAPMRQDLVHNDRNGDRGERTAPTSSHRIGHRNPHRGSRSHLVLLKLDDEFFEILNSNATACATARHSGEVSLIQSQLLHSMSQSRAEVDGRTNRNRKAAFDGWFHCRGFLVVVDDVARIDREMQILLAFSFRRFSAGITGVRSFLISSGGLDETGFGGFLFGRLDVGESGSHGVAGFRFGHDFGDGAAARRRYLHHRLIRFDTENVLIGLDLVARSDGNFLHGRFGDRLAELGHQNGKSRHIWFSKRLYTSKC